MRSNQSILKEISPEYLLEGLMLKLKLQYFGHLMWRTDSLEKTLILRKIESRRGRGWDYQLYGHEFEQALGVGDAIQPSHPLSSPFPPAFNLSQHQGLFHWVSSLHQVDKILEFQLQYQTFQWIFWFPLGLIGWISLLSKELSRVFSNIKVQKHQFFGAQLSWQSNSHIHTWPLEKP